MTALWLAIGQHIAVTTGRPFQVEAQRLAGGGSINTGYVLEGSGQRYFVKLNTAVLLSMFDAEAEGLHELARTELIRVPEPICWGTQSDSAYLVLEYLDLGRGRDTSFQDLGRRLAQLHRVQGSHYGWHRHNTIGSTPQINTRTENWLEFWQQHRLGYQLSLAARKGHRGKLQRQGDRLLAELPQWLRGYQPVPSLLHGDLWGGNFAVDAQGTPVIFDPAVYYGDREADLAMTELFGGFSSGFYQAYAAHWPLDSGYEVRKVLYNLYHVLNHLNLFGGGYLGQAERMIEVLLSEIR